jgi:hypothetical protein
MRYVVLGDGETFWGFEDCSIIEVPEDWDLEDIEDCLKGRRGQTAQITTAQVEMPLRIETE